MSFKLNWRKLQNVQKYLLKSGNLEDNAELTFIMVLPDYTTKKTKIKFKDFLQFFWNISENPKGKLLALLVQDNDGRIVYRHKEVTAENEEIPTGGNTHIVQNWNSLPQTDKDVYLRILLAQINAYDR